MTLRLGCLFGQPLCSLNILHGAFQQMWSVSDRRAKHLIVGTFLLIVGSSIVAGLSPLMLKALVDALDTNSSQTVTVSVVYLLVAYAFAHWLSKSLGVLRGTFLGRAEQRVHRHLSNKYFQHVMSLPLQFHIGRKTGALSQTLTNGLLGYRIVLYHLTNSILPVLIELATMMTILVSLGHTQFLVILGLPLSFYAIALSFGAKRVGTPARNASTAHIDTNAVFTDALLNFETVKYFNGESQVHNRFSDALRKTESHWAKLYTRRAENGLIVAAIFTLSLGFSVYFATGAVQQGSMSIGEFVLVNAYLIQLIRPLEMIGVAFQDMVQGVAFIDRMSDLLDEEREVDLASNSTPVSVSCGELAFQNISFGYDADRCVLRDVSFVVPPGNTLAIVGASGSGKSSLIRLLLRLLDPHKGQISLGGVALANIPIATLRKAIAVVPQDTVLFNDSIAYNIAFGKQGSSVEEIELAAKVADIHNFVAGLPDGYDTKVGECGAKLSGGEKQRLAIARVAIKQPEIFVFDEATSSLDARTESAILKNFVKMAEGKTTVIIAHRLSTVAHADEIIVLDHGRVIEKGTHNTLIQYGSGTYAAMWHAQHEAARRMLGEAALAC